MAQIIMTAGEVEKLVVKVRPAVEEWAGNLAREREIWYGARTRARNAAKDLDPDEINRRAIHRNAVVNANKKFWQRAETMERSESVVRSEMMLAGMVEDGHVLDRFRDTEPDVDHITPVLNYLEALTAKLDPEATIALSEKETFQMKKAMEIADVDDPRIEDGVS